jgi:hypothetical protein
MEALMKDKMIGFYRPSDDEFREMWNAATFVLDANILLDLYRFPSKASQELLGALEKLADRLWIPHHAALEYQRNRLTVIAEQKRTFSKVRDAIEETKAGFESQTRKLQLKKRHSSIDMDEFMSGFDKLTSDFLETLGKLDENQPNVSVEDPMRIKIDALLSGKIGDNPFDQKAVDEIYKEGERRYSGKIPPGFKDSKKEKAGEPDSFLYGGVIYKRKFGDLILWKQLISHVRTAGLKCVVLLTDDDKEDWWWEIDSEGKKKIGPRPELVEEIRREGGAEKFYIYNSDQFMKFSKEYLGADISDESIDQVRDVKSSGRVNTDFGDWQQFGYSAEQAVGEWLDSVFPSSRIEKTHVGFPDFVVYDSESGRKLGFEIKTIRNPRMMSIRLREPAYRAYYEIKEKGFDEITIIFVVEGHEDLDEAMLRIGSRKDVPPNVGVLFGLIESHDDPPQVVFKPVSELV